MTGRFCLFICCAYTIFVAADDNIALNKPAYQSSVRVASYSTDPGNIVDGNLNRNINHGSCSMSLDEDVNPWWMVDLERPFEIHNITIVNRGDWKKEYLHDFYIEMFRVHPLTWTETTATPCFFYDGILYDVETLVCDEKVIGRYVRIRKISRPNQVRITLCEVEVRGTEVQKQECGNDVHLVNQGKRLSSSTTTTVMSESQSDCLHRCRYNADCYDINFNVLTKSCEMILARSGSDSLLDDQDSVFVTLP